MCMGERRHLICMEINSIIIMFHSSGFKSARQPVLGSSYPELSSAVSQNKMSFVEVVLNSHSSVHAPALNLCVGLVKTAELQQKHF